MVPKSVREEPDTDSSNEDVSFVLPMPVMYWPKRTKSSIMQLSDNQNFSATTTTQKKCLNLTQSG